MLFFEFTKMLKDEQNVKRCKLCGRYFVLTDKRRGEFCDRSYQGNRICKKVGPKAFFDKDVGSDDYLRQYLTEYNKVYSRWYRADGKYAREFSGKDITREQFEAWRRSASRARREYVEKKISGEELLAKIRLE